MEKFSTGSRRDSRTGKGRFDLIPWDVITLLSKRFESGANSYGDRNWEKGQPLGRYLDSGLRHLFQFLEGRTDEDHHIAAIWNLIAMVWTIERIKDKSLPESLDDLRLIQKQNRSAKQSKTKPL
jgi:hypothetical protein